MIKMVSNLMTNATRLGNLMGRAVITCPNIQRMNRQRKLGLYAARHKYHKKDPYPDSSPNHHHGLRILSPLLPHEHHQTSIPTGKTNDETRVSLQHPYPHQHLILPFNPSLHPSKTHISLPQTTGPAPPAPSTTPSPTSPAPSAPPNNHPNPFLNTDALPLHPLLPPYPTCPGRLRERI